MADMAWFRLLSALTIFGDYTIKDNNKTKSLMSITEEQKEAVTIIFIAGFHSSREVLSR